MDYRERYKQQYGYTDEMLRLDELMEEFGMAGAIVKVTDKNGDEYVGEAGWYSKADDEEDGLSTICVDEDEDEGWIFSVADIQDIEEVGID